MANRWHEIWSKRRWPESTSDGAENFFTTLQKMLLADGFDSGASRLDVGDWLNFCRRVRSICLIEKGASIFEVGCGSGAFLYPFYQAGFPTGGLDFSPSLLAMAQAHMPDAELQLAEARSLSTWPRYDHVLSYGVFLYFPDHAYAKALLQAMLGKARRSVGIFDVPDLTLKDKCEAAREALLPPGEYRKKYAECRHLYYTRDWFARIGEEYGAEVRCFSQNITGYANSAFRFNVTMRLKRC